LDVQQTSLEACYAPLKDNKWTLTTFSLEHVPKLH
jgi:hypothetical protein